MPSWLPAFRTNQRRRVPTTSSDGSQPSSMEQFRQVGEVLGSLKALLVFRDEIRINQRQCCLLVDAFNWAFERIAEEMKQNLKFDERSSKWKALEQPLKELHRVFREGELYIRQCMGTKDWWAKAISLSKNTDCIEFHLHNLLWCIPVVMEAIEYVAEISGCDEDEIQNKRVYFAKKFDKEWMDPKLFQRKFGNQYLVFQDIRGRIDGVWREDRWVLMQTISEKRSEEGVVLTKQESRVADLLSKNLDMELPSKGKLFPSSILVGAKDYQVRRRLGSGSQYKEIQWMGEVFAVRHFFGDVDSLIPDISYLSSLSHPNIMHFLCGFCDDEKKECFLVMELMSKDLASYTKEICGPRKKIPFSLLVAVDIMLQIARGMECLHARKIYHGDLNPCNVLVKTKSAHSEGYLHVKVAGFGLTSVKKFISSRASPNQQNNINTNNNHPFIWYAPEVLSELEQTSGTASNSSSSSKYTEKADVYSFGMICFELLTGKVPFEDSHLQGDKMSRNIRAGERPLFPFPTPKYLTNLTKKCWQTDPLQRPSFSSVCRILRYIKRFLVLNPEHSQPGAPAPPADYFDLELNLLKKFPAWSANGVGAGRRTTQIPFEMFAYRVIEKERTALGIRDKSSESSGSEGTSGCGDENGVATEDSPYSTPSRSSSMPRLGFGRKLSVKKPVDGTASRTAGRSLRGGTLRPPQTLANARSLRTNSEVHLQPIVLTPTCRKSSGHASDSELTKSRSNR